MVERKIKFGPRLEVNGAGLIALITLLLPAIWLDHSLGLAQESKPANNRIALENLFEDYFQEYLILFPIEATNFGDTRYNDQLQIDVAPEFVARKRNFYQRTLSRLNAIEIQTVDDATRLMAEILKYELETRLRGLDFGFERIPFNQFESLPLTFAQMGSGKSSQPFRTVVDYENWLNRIERFEVWTHAAIARFDEGIRTNYVLPSILVERMVKQMLDPTIVTDDPTQNLFYAPVQNFPDSISDVDQKRLRGQYVQTIAQRVVPSYRRLGEYLRDDYLPHCRTTSGISALKDGRTQYQYWVNYWTTTDATPDEVFETGEREVARIREEMRQVQKEMGFSGTLEEYFEYLRTSSQFKPYHNPEEVLAAFHAIQHQLEPHLATAFLNRPKTSFEIRRTESFREKTASAEYMPGSADGSRPGIFYCPIPDVTEFNVTSGMESLFLHEALPGHHYQISLQQENERLPKFARFLWYGAYGEGWGLYCESIGAELGLYTDPRQRIGALGDEIHRAIRLVVDVGMHWKGWTREQALEYMMSNEPISEDGAVAEVERYMAYTAQALSYKTGQLKIRELRAKCEQRLGTRFSLAGFHDMVLRDGCMPLSILERRLDAWEP
ncbi:MAG: DUF885 domain-containing protein [Planctomycetales bacterium]|nr:DUF885 domain-containing protein [Planctomycetales bacterium]